LIENGLEWAWVNREERITFLHVGAILEMARNDDATYLRLHLHGLISCTGTDLIQVKRHVLCDNFSNSRWTRRGLSSFSLAGYVLINSVGDKPCQQDEKQVRPFRNFLICSAGSLRLRLDRPVGRAVIQCFNVAQFCVKFHFNTPTRREIAPFLVIE